MAKDNNNPLRKIVTDSTFAKSAEKDLKVSSEIKATPPPPPKKKD